MADTLYKRALEENRLCSDNVACRSDDLHVLYYDISGNTFQHLLPGLRGDLVNFAQRHRGEDQRCWPKRHALYQQARNPPYRWSGATRNWQPTCAVTFNPERSSQR